MRKRKKAISDYSISNLSHFMGSLQPDQKSLTEIQAVYDNLTLLGQLLGAGTDISSMRSDFNALATVLLDQLALEHYKKASLNLGSCARVAIDVLTRNLFERTADIGFLATDSEICAFAEAVEHDPKAKHDSKWQSQLRAHFKEYVNKYSVYHNIILLSPSGEVLIQLDEKSVIAHSRDPLIETALKTKAGYVEVFRPSDLLPDVSSPLIYAYRVMSKDNSHAVGVLCLCFKIQDECQRIFEGLIAEDDWTIFTLLDASGLIIASSDPYQFPIGMKVEIGTNKDSNIIHFGGRQFLSATSPSTGYQGYPGPGWLGQSMAPLNLAFEMSGSHELETVQDKMLNCVLETATIFSQELRDIPIRAENIQQELNRAVWNGNIWLTSDNVGQNASFAKVLLREIGSTGVRTLNVFSKSTTNLYKTVLASVLFDCGTQAALAIDIMDRNLYERANDCRWWALTQSFSEALAKSNVTDAGHKKRVTEVLRKINSLYTVYTNLILFDLKGIVIAVSNAEYNHWIGKTLPDNLVRPTLGLKNSQNYCVSSFSATDIYGGQATYIYSAAIRKHNSSAAVGGISIVFDAKPQFEAMLQDALPRLVEGGSVPGAFAVFAERDGKVISSTNDNLIIGSKILLDDEFFNLGPGDSCTNIVVYDNAYYAVGSCMSAGYREFKSAEDIYQSDVLALIFSPLSDRVINADHYSASRNVSSEKYTAYKASGIETVDIASFYIGKNWYGIETSYVVEAIDSVQLTSMPLTSSIEKGCLIHQGHVVTVFDLSNVVNDLKPAEERRTGRNIPVKPQILILSSVKEKIRFGLLVDRLGEINEIPVTQFDPVPTITSKTGSFYESIIKAPEGSLDRRILIVLSIDKIINKLAHKN